MLEEPQAHTQSGENQQNREVIVSFTEGDA